MTNFEEYKNKIMELGAQFAVTSDMLRVVPCDDMDCERCLFYDPDDLFGCNDRMIRWFGENNEEPTIDWSTIPVDARVLVSDDGEYWRPRYFAGVDSNGTPMVWAGGMASWTAGDDVSDTLVYNYIKLAKEEE